jgi:FkbM family methyltransferase
MGNNAAPKSKRSFVAGLTGYALSAVVGLGLFLTMGWGIPRASIAIDLIKGKPTQCPLLDTLGLVGAANRFSKERDEAVAEVKIIETDAALGIERVQTRGRAFWVKAGGDEMNGKDLIAYLLGEHRWVTKENPELQVKPGDIVVDCGAHVGIFTDKALKLGAAKVISVEIDPINIECLRRNFKQEIAEGRVVVVTKGVWSKDGTMPFTVAKTNSGMGSLVTDSGSETIISSGSETIQVPITTLDKIVAELNVPKVNYIKMDIEGAEREALAGAAGTLAKFKPILMLDAYHRPDDPQVLPRVVLGANAGYQERCGPCEMLQKDFRPHIVYFR